MRDRQTEFPYRKVLSVTVPGVEALVAGDFHRPLLLATQVTITSGIYASVLQKAYSNYQIQWSTQVGSGRVDALENGTEQDLIHAVEHCDLGRFVGSIDSIVLGCTHYPLLQSLIRSYLPDLPIIDSAYESAKKIASYLGNHQEIDLLCTR